MYMQKILHAIRFSGWSVLTLLVVYLQYLGVVLVVPMSSKGVAPCKAFYIGWFLTALTWPAFFVLQEKVFSSRHSYGKTCSIILLAHAALYYLWMGGCGLLSFLADDMPRYWISGLIAFLASLVFAFTTYFLYQQNVKWH